MEASTVVLSVRANTATLVVFFIYPRVYIGTLQREPFTTRSWKPTDFQRGREVKTCAIGRRRRHYAVCRRGPAVSREKRGRRRKPRGVRSKNNYVRPYVHSSTRPTSAAPLHGRILPETSPFSSVYLYTRARSHNDIIKYCIIGRPPWRTNAKSAARCVPIPSSFPTL